MEPERKRLRTSSIATTEADAFELIIAAMKDQQQDRGRRHNTVELAIQLLQKEYQVRLSTSHFVDAVDFLTVEAKASAFITLNSSIRDIWLCKNLDVELI